ncbi:MAG: metallophosphoesterase [Paludibacteraceae bacterium]|nr:metallophosphoesterase [Paludibacteraceae bacterium]
MKLSNFQILIFPILFLLLLSCNPNYDLAGFLNGTSPKVSTRFEQSIAYNDSVGVPAVVVPSADYRVYVCTDSHIDSIPTNLTTFVQAAAADTLCPFALHLGDLVNAQGHIPYAVSLLTPNQSPLTTFLALGNHDIYFNQWDEWRSYFGTSVYWFYTMLPDSTVLDRFICLDSAEGTIGTAQLQWLRELLTKNGSQPSTVNAQHSSFRHTIVFTHTHFFRRDHSQEHTSNYAIEETYELTSLLEQGGVDMYWCGHDHSREITDYAGFTSIVVDAIEDHYPPAFYMVATLSDQINYQFIQLP